MPPLTVVFDLDGTLVETAPDLVDTLNWVFRREGLPELPYAEARNMIGGGARRMIENGLRLEGRVVDDAEMNRMLADFLRYYGEHVADRSRPFPGLDAALDQLARHGFRFAVCTNKREGLSRLLLEALKMTHRFEAICGPDTFNIYKPDPEILRRTIRAAGGAMARSIMVGDSETDIATARAAGIPIVAVDFGYSEIPVEKLTPDRLISHYEQLVPAVLELAQRPEP
jgi:phosphoglycolate phosphatase